jgi:hypothetical protein
VLTYLYTRTEGVLQLTAMIERRMSGATVEVFSTRDQWLQKMIELGVNSPFVVTLHYSDPPSILGGRSNEYFEKLHEAVRQRPLEIVYRRVATLSSPEKAKWLLRTVHEMCDCANFSLGYVDVDHRQTPLLCLEVGQDRGVYYTFVFSTVPPAGTVSAVLVRDNAVGQAALAAFERIWENSQKLKEGLAINKHGIQELAQKQDILQSEEYRAIENIVV